MEDKPREDNPPSEEIPRDDIRSEESESYAHDIDPRTGTKREEEDVEYGTLNPDDED